MQDTGYLILDTGYWILEATSIFNSFYFSEQQSSIRYQVVSSIFFKSSHIFYNRQ
jgi:hypothetical protein